MNLPSVLRKHEAKITGIVVDHDGWKLVYLNPGWICQGLHRIAHYTWREITDSLAKVEQCNCNYCQGKKD